MSEFIGWPKTSRLFSPIVVSEKIDGTNGQVYIVPVDDPHTPFHPRCTARVGVGLNPEHQYDVYAGSRNRWVKPGDDNLGFAAWVYDNVELLITTLGEGRHYGEWFGQGIQRGFGGQGKYFALFNAVRWKDIPNCVSHYHEVPGLRAAPILYSGEYDPDVLWAVKDELSRYGSVVAPGFYNPEGLIVHFVHNRTNFKVIINK